MTLPRLQNHRLGSSKSPAEGHAGSQIHRSGRPIGLLTKSAFIAVVVIVGVASSGVIASPFSFPSGKTALRATARLGDTVPLPSTTTTSTSTSPTAASTIPPRAVVKATTTASSTPTTPSSLPPATPSPAVVTPPAGVIGASGTHLTLNGATYRFTGMNAYELATDYGVNAGCGPQLTPAQLDAFFASLRPNSLVRIGAPQGSVAINVTTHQLDWGPLDAVFAAATAYGQRLIVSLASQGAVCDGLHWQDVAWYSGGFMHAYNDPSNSDGAGLDPLPYWNYLQDVVNRYKNSPALGMWEPMSEGGPSTCPAEYQPANCIGHAVCTDEAASAQAFRYFFDVVGGEIHALDPNHLVESGMLGSGQCGTNTSDYQYVSASPGIDVLSYHDYYPDVIGGDQWNGVSVRLAQSVALQKPIIAGEMGEEAGTGPGCTSLAQRSSDLQAKLEAQFASGSSGGLIWNWTPAMESACSMDVVADDPTMSMLASIPL